MYVRPYKEAEMRLQSERDLSLLVARRRKELGLTQEQLSKQAGVRRATLADLERGGTTPSFTTVTALLAALDLMLDVSPAGAARGLRTSSLDEVLDRVRT